MTLNDQKVILSIIAQIRKDDDDFQEYEMSVSDLSKITTISHQRLRADLAKITKRLTSKTIMLTEPDGFAVMPWFCLARYTASESKISFKISPDLKPYLIQLQSGFTSYYLQQVIHMKSAYSIRMYELLKCFIGKHGKYGKPYTLSIPDLRKELAVPEGKYKAFENFRRSVIEKTQKELAEKSDIHFDFELIKTGRSVTSIEIKPRQIKKIEVEQAANDNPQVMPDNVAAVFDELASVLEQAIPDPSLLLKHNAMEVIQLAMEETANAKALGTIKKSPTAFFMSVLRNLKIEGMNIDKTTAERLTNTDWADGLD